MKEKPILFSGPMVRALLNGSKTQTRRPVKPQPTPHDGGYTWEPIGGMVALSNGKIYESKMLSRCPYRSGDTLWVREGWRVEMNSGFHDIRYRADNGPFDPGTQVYSLRNRKCWVWRPSIHMPRWASRITLEVTKARVERLREITNDDCWAEGITVPPEVERAAREMTSEYDFVEWWPQLEFETLWDSIYAKKGLGWDKNPWVWLIEFKRCT